MQNVMSHHLRNRDTTLLGHRQHFDRVCRSNIMSQAQLFCVWLI